MKVLQQEMNPWKFFLSLQNPNKACTCTVTVEVAKQQVIKQARQNDNGSSVIFHIDKTHVYCKESFWQNKVLVYNIS